MKRLLAIGVALAVSAAAFAGLGSRSAVADPGYGPNFAGSEAPPVIAGQSSIDHVSCFGDGGNALWRKSNLTFTIQGGEQFSYEAVNAVAKGVLAWNKVGAPFTLTRSGSPEADIGILIYPRVDLLFGGGILGGTFTDCFVSTEGNFSATIYLGVSITSSLVNLNMIQNVASHEAGHALGLGHANDPRDLMFPFADPRVMGARIICPSTLDVAGLTSRNPINSMSVGSWREVACQ